MDGRFVPNLSFSANVVAACRPHATHRTLSRIRDLGVRSGVALNPATPLECVRHVLDLVDVLLVMTVNPASPGRRISSPWKARSPRPAASSPGPGCRP
jgi:pentose-5-phosphate-3-epimerase